VYFTLTWEPNDLGLNGYKTLNCCLHFVANGSFWNLEELYFGRPHGRGPGAIFLKKNVLGPNVTKISFEVKLGPHKRHLGVQVLDISFRIVERCDRASDF